MKQKIYKILNYVLQIVLTALASAGIALLQNYLESKGVKAGDTLDPQNTGVIGSAVAGIKIAINNFKNNMIV